MTSTPPSDREVTNFNRAIGLLGLLCRNYDMGALDIASLISNLLAQLLLKKGRGNVPLFEQVGWSTQTFPIVVNARAVPDEGEKLQGTPLASFIMGINTSEEKIIPVAMWVCDFQHYSDDQTFVRVTCQEWLDMPAVATPAGEMTRREIIEYVRDKDGGAHSDTDSRMSEAGLYLETAAFIPPSRDSVIDINGEEYNLSFTPPVTMAMLRQMAHELLSSIWSFSDFSDQFQPQTLVAIHAGDNRFLYAMAPEGYPPLGKIYGTDIMMVEPHTNPGLRKVEG